MGLAKAHGVASRAKRLIQRTAARSNAGSSSFFIEATNAQRVGKVESAGKLALAPVGSSEPAFANHLGQ